MEILTKRAALAAAATLLVPAAAHAQGGALIFHVSHVRDEAGHIRIDVCTHDTFLKAGCPYSGSAPAVKDETTVVVPNVAPGVYAAQVYHDRNDDGQVNRSPLGIPTEGVGFTNNAPVGLTGPKWAKAAFSHDVASQELAVRLRHFP